MATSFSPQQRRDVILTKLRATRDRNASYSFRCVQALLKSSGMPSAPGWAPLLAKYESLNYADTRIDWDKYVQTAHAIFNGSIYAGNSATWVFTAPTAVLEALASNIIVSQGELAQQFPSPLPNGLIDSYPFRTEFVAKLSDGAGATIVFACGKRAYRTREQFEPENLLPEVLEALGSFQELILVRAGFTQSYDRIIIRPDLERLELHIDMCCPLNTEELHQLQIDYSSRLKKIIGSQQENATGWLNSPANLFPKIQELYNAVDGRILSLGHVTSTNSIKAEKMRGVKADLRKERFHESGLAAVRGTDLYSIKKGWDSVIGNTPSVFIPGISGNAGVVGAAVRHAILENAATIEDFDLLVDHLV